MKKGVLITLTIIGILILSGIVMGFVTGTVFKVVIPALKRTTFFDKVEMNKE